MKEGKFGKMHFLSLVADSNVNCISKYKTRLQQRNNIYFLQCAFNTVINIEDLTNFYEIVWKHSKRNQPLNLKHSIN